MVPIWAAVVTMVSLPLTIMACFTVVGARAARRGQAMSKAQMARFMPWFTSAGFVVSAGLGALFVARYGVSMSTLRIGAPSLAAVGAAIVVGTVGAVAWSAMMKRLRPQAACDDDGPMDRIPTAWSLTLAIGAGVCEEWVFRGVALASFDAAHGLWIAAIATGVIFGLAHAYQGLVSILTTGLIGTLFLLAVILPFESLVAGMLAHALWDLTMIFYVGRRSRARSR